MDKKVKTMLEIRNCKICGIVFQYTGFFDVCIDCRDHDENEFDKIRQYLYEHPCASIFEVANTLDITLKKIKYYLREGRLEILEKINSFLDCEMCKQPIRSGRYCEECSKKAAPEPHDYIVFYIGNNNNPNNRLNYISNSGKKLKKAAAR